LNPPGVAARAPKKTGYMVAMSWAGGHVRNFASSTKATIAARSVV